MDLFDVLQEDKMILHLKGTNKNEIFKEMATKLLETNEIDNLDEFLEEINKREMISSTALENGICMPHAKTKLVSNMSIVFGRSLEGVDCDSMDKQVSNLFFLIATPENNSDNHIAILSKLSKLLLDDGFRKSLLDIKSEKDVTYLIKEKITIKEEKLEYIESEKLSKDLILAVTACPTGIAHTYMAEEALKVAAKELNINLKVETNGTDGIKNKLTNEDIRKAKAIILAIDRGVETERFKGKQVIESNTKVAINDSKSLLIKAVNVDSNELKGSNLNIIKNLNNSNNGKEVYRHLMTGVSFMLPFVISGGIFIALAFIVDRMFGVQGGADLGRTTASAQLLMDIGGKAFELFIPVLGAYIAYSIADRLALTAGFIGGMIASTGGAGFLGAIAGGFLAGYVTKGTIFLLRNTPKGINGIKAILLYPIITVGITGIILILFLNKPIEFINDSLTFWLDSMAGGSKILLGLILGGMMAIDMGGPINKAAYVFGISTLANGNEYGTSIMAVVMAGGMVPPLGIALATTIFKRKFNEQELEAGKTNFVLGLTFITEGAIPFATADPFRVIPSSAIGSAAAGALVMFFDIMIPVPHGGLVVMFLSNKPFIYITMIVIGSAVTCGILGTLKKSSY